MKKIFSALNGPRRQKLIVYSVLTAVTLAVYWQVHQFDFFIIDDPLYVTQNIHIRSGITPDGLRWAFGTIYADYFIPLTWLSFMVDYRLYGLTAGGYHATNLILHIISVLLLFWFFNRTTGKIWRSAFVAALFALHPLHVESVAWITCRNNVLSVFFCMLALCLYVSYAEKPDIKRYLLVLTCFACALMSKPIIITLPVVMILLDYWPLHRFEAHKKDLILWQLKEKIPFFVLSTVVSVITIYTRSSRPIGHFSFSSRIANALVSFITYPGKTFWPHDLAVYYPFPDQIPAWQIIGAFLLIIIITSFVVVNMKRLSYLFVGWFWYVITIAPVIGILQDNEQAMTDRHYYLPSIGIAVMLAWGIPLLFSREDLRKKILFTSGIAIIAILAFLTWRQCGYWKNSIELSSHTVQVTKNNFVMHNLLGVALFKEGRAGEAMDHYNEAILLKPDYTHAYLNRGVAYYNLGRYQRAVEDYDQVIRLSPHYAEGYNNRGLAYGKLGRHQLAVDNFSEAIRLNPDDADAYNNRGFAYLLQGNKELGCRDAQKACEQGRCKLFEFAENKSLCR